MAATIDVPYLVVGAGPVGLTAARLLAGGGRRCLVVERRDGSQRHPAAHVVNARTLEILRQAGLDMDAIDAIAQDPADAGHVNFLTRLTGELIGRLPFERQGDDCLALTPTPLRNISQHRLEPLLAAAVADRPTAEVRYRWAWESSEQDADGVTTVVRDLDSGEPFEVRSHYLVAADGAASPVRKSLGIDAVGPRRLDSFVTIHLGVDLRPVVADRPGVLHFVMDPEVSGAFVAHDVDREWVYMVGFDPEEESIDDYDPARCEAIVRAAIGGYEGPVEVHGAGVWHMTAQVAERYGDGRVFLVGDAAHRFPPTGGLGLNTGVADAHNLAWKLGAVEEGWADPGLLDTYESERRPVAVVNCEQSTENAMRIALLLEALDLTDPADGAAMYAALADPARRPVIDAAVAAQATHFDLLGLQLGHGYAVGALARDDGPPPGPPDPSHVDTDAGVGSRLPHAWTVDGRSTLDLVEPQGLTLITVGAHEHWARAAATVTVPLHQVRLGPDVAVADRWRSQCRLGPDGALLVRPDQHVAWRGPAADAAVGLVDAVHRVVGPAPDRALDPGRPPTASSLPSPDPQEHP